MNVFKYLADISISLEDKLAYISKEHGSMPEWYQNALKQLAEEGSHKPDKAVAQHTRALESLKSTFIKEIERLEGGAALSLSRMEAADLLDQATRIVELAKAEYHKLSPAEEAQAMSRVPIIQAQLARVMPAPSEASMGPLGVQTPDYSRVYNYLEELRAKQDKAALYVISQVAGDETVRSLAAQPLGVKELDTLESEIRTLGARYRYLADIDQETRKAYAVGHTQFGVAEKEQYQKLRASGYYSL